ncbi:MAG: DUF2924 domain-containing protein [bacterium]|nr:DUF2924 domain-containing protein [bacterium]
MAPKLTKEEKRTLQDARNLIVAVQRTDGNEAETRRRVERIFERVLGYDPLINLSRERAVHGAGDTEHVDFVVQLEEGPDAPPLIMVELKRVGIDLAPKHLKQASRYAVDAGCEWVLLTNGRDWRLYHVEFGQPPKTKLVEQWNLLKDDSEVLSHKFDCISLKSLRKGYLDTLWQRTDALSPESFLQALVAPETIKTIRRILRRSTGVSVNADHVAGALRRMLNETAACVLEDVEIVLPHAREREDGPTRTRRRGPGVEMADILQCSLLSPGTVLFKDYKGQRFEAVIQPDGWILFENERYKTPSAAGGAVTEKFGVHSPNGWWFWQVADSTDTAQPLEAVRKRYIEMKADKDASDHEEDALNGEQ